MDIGYVHAHIYTHNMYFHFHLYIFSFPGNQVEKVSTRVISHSQFSIDLKFGGKNNMRWLKSAV